ncbi:hypothetical protein HYZ70_00115 [Candidatus Curtissbacteria bacterium]|nr:hypothetical protein [Candidatus Curtissbacteria bacterium]
MLPVPDFNRIKEKGNNFNLLGKAKVKILIVASCILLAMITAQLVFAANLATDGEKLSRIYEEMEKLEAENTKLRIEIAQDSSLTNLAKLAEESGFAKPSKVITP